MTDNSNHTIPMKSTLASVNTASCHLLILLTFVICAKAQQPPITDTRALERRLANTDWTHVNTDDTVMTGGIAVIKDGAWLKIRLRGEGRYSAWHKDRIVHESRWEVVDQNTVRLHDCGPNRAVGLMMRFNTMFTAYTCTNDGRTSGNFVGRAGPPDLLVGRWHWNGPGVAAFREDGVAIPGWPGNWGKWRSLGNDRYEVNWGNGKYVDRVRIKSGNKELACENQFGHKFGGRRVGTK